MLSIEAFKNAAIQEIRNVGLDRTWFSAPNKHGPILHFVVWTVLQDEVRVYDVNAMILYHEHDFKKFIEDTLDILKSNEVNVRLVLQDNEAFHHGISTLSLLHLTKFWYDTIMNWDVIEQCEPATPANTYLCDAFKIAVQDLQQFHSDMKQLIATIKHFTTRNEFPEDLAKKVFHDSVLQQFFDRISAHTQNAAVEKFQQDSHWLVHFD